MKYVIFLIGIMCVISIISSFDYADAKILLTGGDGGDCKFIGMWNQSSKTCKLTENIDDFVFVKSSSVDWRSWHGLESDNYFYNHSSNDGITIDGNNHTLKIKECQVTGTRDSRMQNYNTALKIEANNIVVKNLTITGTQNPNCSNDSEWDATNGVLVGLNTILLDNIIEGHKIGIMITNNDAQLIKDNTIRFNEKGISFRERTFDSKFIDNNVHSNGIDMVIHSQNYDYADVMNTSDTQSNSQVMIKPVIEKISPPPSMKSSDDIPFGIISGGPENIKDKQTNEMIEQSISDNSKQSSQDTTWNMMLVLLVLSIFGVGLFWVITLTYELGLGGKIFLGIVIIWTFFWILVLIGNIIGEEDSWALGIVVYVFVGLPTTIGAWWLWARISSRKNSGYTSEYVPEVVTKSIPKYIINTSPVLPKQTTRVKQTRVKQTRVKQTRVKQTRVKQTRVKQTRVKHVLQNNPLEILKERLVKGEISIDEFNNLKSELGL